MRRTRVACISRIILHILLVSMLAQFGFSTPSENRLFQGKTLSENHLSQRESTYQMFSDLLEESKGPKRILPAPLVCPFKQYIGASSCIACLPDCMKCTNGTSCSECFPGFVLSNGRCCEVGKWFTAGACAACGVLPPDCLTCSTTATYCSICRTGFTATNGKCCPNGQFFNTGTSTCQACTAPCTTCTNSATFCTSCNAANPQLFLSSGKCCPNGTFWRVSSSSCVACHASCVECVGQGQYKCRTCVAGKNAYKFGAGCCNNGQTDDGVTGCVNCHSSCAVCDWTTKEDCNVCTNSALILSYGDTGAPAAGYCVPVDPFGMEHQLEFATLAASSAKSPQHFVLNAWSESTQRVESVLHVMSAALPAR
jgi:hypothetical protein